MGGRRLAQTPTAPRAPLKQTAPNRKPTEKQGLLDDGAGRERVVLKRVKARVAGADEMVQMEHLINVYASKAARGAVEVLLSEAFGETERSLARVRGEGRGRWWAPKS